MKKLTKIFVSLSVVVCALMFVACSKESKKKDTTIEINNGTMAENGTVLKTYIGETDSFTLNFELEPEKATIKDLNFKITGDDIATVKDGVIKVKKDNNGDMIAGTCTVTVSAKKGEFTASCDVQVIKAYAKIGEDYLTSISALEEKIAESQAISLDVKLMFDIDYTNNMFDVASGKTLNLDLNGRNLNMGEYAISNEGVLNITNSSEKPSTITTSKTMVNSSGELTINGVSVSQTNSESDFALSSSGELNLINANINAQPAISSTGTLNITNSEIEANKYSLAVAGGTTTITSGTIYSNENAIVVNNDASLVVNGGTITAKKETILGDGETEMNVTINNGTIESEEAVAIVMNSQGSLIIGAESNTPEIKGLTAINLFMGDITINRANLVSDETISTITTTEKSSVDGSSILIMTNGYAFEHSSNDLTVNINSSLSANKEIAVYTALNNEENDVKVAQKTMINNNSGIIINYIPTQLIFEETTINWNISEGALNINPVLPVNFSAGQIIYELVENDNFQYQEVGNDGELTTATILTNDSQTYDSKICPEYSNGITIAKSAESGTDEMVSSFKIRVSYMIYTGDMAVNNPSPIELTINIVG
ncbi:MAG: hypothetical protein IJZ77_03115 [Bacilli bacterium]|nr:hypothetical protein [Bacilli bacterium]